MARRSISFDPYAQFLTQFEWDNIEQRGVLSYTQRVGPLLDRNKELKNDGSGGWDKTRQHRRIAGIPAIVVVEWLNRYGVNALDPTHQDGVDRLLADPDWSYLRGY